MPNQTGRRSAAGFGSIRRKTFVQRGKTYTYWEARYTEGYDPLTGKQVQRTINGKTQREVAQRLRKATAELAKGMLPVLCSQTVGQWLELWSRDYLIGIRPSTAYSYRATIRNHIQPAFCNVRLEDLTPHMIQQFYKRLSEERSPKTVRNIHGVFHCALQQAVKNGLLSENPAEACVLPRKKKSEPHPMDESLISSFLEAIRGECFEQVFFVTLFTGLRRGEVLGLTWDAIDFTRGTIRVDKQLQRARERRAGCTLVETKSGKARLLTPAKDVVDALQLVKKRQSLWAQASDNAFSNPMNLVFTDSTGRHLEPNTVYNHFKRIVQSIGAPEARFHDLRHSYAVISLQMGDDVKTVQENLGHASAAFTMDVYGSVTSQMKKASANRMEQFIQSLPYAPYADSIHP
ncbi:MAG: site-specific integrase [Oscillospiraceae bacterium]|nr:site-specific integrase [Oscillospiraceae bacterium]